ncbi:MAG: CRISPR-associated protein Cas5 [Ignisphaera sp.]
MYAIAFKIKAPFGHFRNPYTTAFKQTYPFPPKPTIIGLTGAILGWDEKTVLEKIDEFKIAIPFLANKGKMIEYTFIFGVGKLRGDSRGQEEFRPERFEILLYPEYEIILLHEYENTLREIEIRIKSRDFEFPLYMGKNEFLITHIEISKDVFNVDEVEIEKPSGVIFVEGNTIPQFEGFNDRFASAEVFMGVPKSLKNLEGRRIQKETCVVLLPKKTPIKLVKPLPGIKIDEAEYTII